MSDSKTQDSTRDWEALQRQYWTAWSDLTRKTAASSADTTAPWQSGVEQWQRMFSGVGKQNDTTERVLESAKGYAALMQSMLGATSGQNFTAPSAQAWMDTLRNGFNSSGVDLALLNNPMAKALHDISGQGVQGFEQWAAGAAPMVEQLRAQGLSWLHAPTFGYNREHQEHRQKTLLAFAEFQEAVKHYSAMIMKSSQCAFGIFENKLAERSEPGRQIDSMRAFYDLWVDSAEEAYAEIALSDEFRKVYGDVVNAQMRVRSLLQQEVERVGVDLGMPTRSELNSVHKRLHELRRRLNENAPHSAMEDQIAALRAEVEALKQEFTGTQPHAKENGSRANAQKKPSPKARVAAKPGGVAFGEAINAMRHQAAAKAETKSSNRKQMGAKQPAKGSIVEPMKSAVISAEAEAGDNAAKSRRVRSKT